MAASSRYTAHLATLYKSLSRNTSVRAAAIVTGLYLILTIVVTWPLVLQFNTAIFGEGGDGPLILWELWASNPAWTQGKSVDDLVGLPFGVQSNLFNEPHSPFYFAMADVPGLFPSAIVEYNTFTLLSFVLSALTAYALAYKITRRPEASFVAGLVYAFAPYHQSLVHAHLIFEPQWIALFILALWMFDDSLWWGWAGLAGAAYAITTAANPYYGLYGAVAGVTLVLVRMIQLGWKAFFTRARIGGYLLAGVAAVLLTLWFFQPLLADLVEAQRQPENSSVSASPYQRSLVWPFYLSARPWDYLLPSTTHLVFGEAVTKLRQQITAIRWGDWRGEAYRYLDLDTDWFWSSDTRDHELYLGYTGLLLAAYGGWQHWRTRKSGTAGGLDRRLITFALVLGLVALWWSAPPWFPIGSLFSRWLPEWMHSWIIPFPIWFVVQAAPFFRVSARIGMLVSLSVGLLASAGLTLWLEKVSTRWVRVGLVGVVSALVAFEYASTWDLLPIYPAPAVYEWLAEQPEGAIVSIPWNNTEDRLYQPVHAKPIIGSDGVLAIDHSPINGLQQSVFADPTQPGAAEKLAALGGRYLIWRSNTLQPPSPKTLPGLRVFRSFETIHVFEITAAPAELIVIGTPRQSMWISNPGWHWQEAQQTLWVWNPAESSRSLDLSLKVAALPEDSILAAEMWLTPPPPEIVVSGILQENPLAGLQYPPQQYQFEKADKENWLKLRRLEVLPGETRMRLAWQGQAVAVLGVEVSINTP